MKRLPSILAAVALVVTTIVGGTGPATAATYEYVKTRFSDTIYRVDAGDWTYTTRTAISYEEWVAAGRPTPDVYEPTDYESLPWSPVIHALTFWPNNTWPEEHALTYDEWVTLGRPAPVRTYDLCDVMLCNTWRWANTEELFLSTQSDPVHKLTFEEWNALGNPAPYVSYLGVYKLPWDGRIVVVTPDKIGPGTTQPPSGLSFQCPAISYAQWAGLDFPTPQVVASGRDDRFLLWTNSSTIYYYGILGYFPITYSQWAGAGFPPPIRTGRVTPQVQTC
ncbi:hypothetical protein L1785_05265 [Antribacter sp. KLBMP9083]|uniref:Secreted protein n=1 Tax=Antribacter soli TaxID=2910976 RepID=A0AA41QC27_9MICO|nr:hypothetical protein [Antribacter soli]MCF4120382.1 hypothetical protein [Antribacter soli]